MAIRTIEEPRRRHGQLAPRGKKWTMPADSNLGNVHNLEEENGYAIGTISVIDYIALVLVRVR